MIEHTLNKLKAHFGWKNQNDIAKALGVEPSGISSRKRRGTLLDAIAKWAAREGHDISDILRAEERGQSIGYTAPPRPPGTTVARQPEKGYDPHGGWKPRTMSEEWHLAGMAVEVLASKTIYAEALKQNIKAFYEAYTNTPEGRKNEATMECEAGDNPGKTSAGGG